jgi:phosphopantothenoylcysteine synthetase/decarboxylase
MADDELMRIPEAAEQMGAPEEKVQAAAAAIGAQLFHGEYMLTGDERAAIRHRLGLPTVLDDDETDDDDDQDEDDEDETDDDDETDDE